MIVRSAVAATILVLLAAPLVVAAPRKTTKADDASTRFAKAASASLDNALKDYPSTRFKDVRIQVLGDGSGGVACGFLNGKNSAGGYVGWQQFAVVGGWNINSRIVLIASDAALTSTVQATCADASFGPGDFSVALSTH